MDVIIQGVHHNVKGLLAMATVDIPASNWLWKFKDGVSFVHKSCRMCNVDGQYIDQLYTDRDKRISLRDMNQHKERCENLESTNLSKGAKHYWSMLWGINGSSCLLELDSFPLTTGLVQDPMHVLLEGVVKNELSLVLFSFMYCKRYFTLISATQDFQYSYLQEDRKPIPFDKKHLDGRATMKQTASAMLTLCEVLPIIITPTNCGPTASVCFRSCAYASAHIAQEYLSTTANLSVSSPQGTIYPKDAFLHTLS